MSALDIDFYKLTMLQFIWAHYADVPVAFRMHSRTQDLRDVIDVDWVRSAVNDYNCELISDEEIAWLKEQGIFGDTFIDDLVSMFYKVQLSEVSVSEDTVETTGSWFNTSLWETVLLSEVAEKYSYDNKIPRPSMFDTVRDVNLISTSGAKWADFGTRRRWSWHTHDEQIEALARESDWTGFIGTSNVDLARCNRIQAIGTYAHELEMVVRNHFSNEFLATRDVLRKWGLMYPPELRIALTDTYGTFNFLSNHGDYLLENDWRGIRLDSGDPFVIGGMVNRWLKERGAHWDVVFSDGLDANTIVGLQSFFEGTNVHPVFGWGTGFTNPHTDLSLVMKATESNGQKTYKITDDDSKSIR